MIFGGLGLVRGMPLFDNGNPYHSKENGQFISKSDTIDRSSLRFTSLRTDWGDFPDIYIAHTSSSIANHPEYFKAKSGDIESALSLVNDYLNDDFLENIATHIKEYRDIAVLPVHAEEQLGRNKIPLAFATALHDVLNLQLETNIVQSDRAYRTQSDGVGRLLKRVHFNGEVQSGKNYLIVDDIVTQGGTLADLKSYIEVNDGIVIGASTLSGKHNSAKMAIRKATLGQLRKQAGKMLENWWQEQFGYDFSKFTESEARYLAKQIHRDGIDTVRNYLATSRFKASGSKE